MNNLFFRYDIYSFLSEIFLINTIFILLVYGVIYSTSLRCGYPVITSTLGWLSLQALIFTFLIHINNQVKFDLAFNNLLVIDRIAIFLKVAILIAGICCLLLSIAYVKQEKLNNFEYFILILLAMVAMLFISSSNDLLTIYLALELQSLIFYILASLRRNSEFSTEAGLKYFILGAFSSGLLLFGIAIIYGITGLTNFEDLTRFFINFTSSDTSISSGVLVGLTFLAVSFFFKISAAPFHIWSPDVYEGAPTITTAFFSIIPKIVILSLFLRLFNKSFHDLFFSWQGIIIICALISLIIGAFAAFAQTRIKRFLAYSSIGHIGYILTGFASSNTEGIVSLLTYLIIYIIIIIGIFSITLSLREYKNKFKGIQIRYLKELSILSKTNPGIALALIVILFSIAGIPPLAGFFSKLLVFLAAMESSLFGLAVAGVLLSCVACFYYIRIIKIIYFDYLHTWPIYIPLDKPKAILVSIVTLLLISFCIEPEIIIIPASLAVNVLSI